jgi:poly(3-hydroxyoctanoate) depolymerase
VAPIDPASRQADALLFLPGASGNMRFWKPVSDGLRHPGRRTFVAYPGFGDVPADPAVSGFDDLVARVATGISTPVDVLAQSMGGVIAMRAALEKPELVRHLVLAVTSGGLDVASLGAEDWRPMFQDLYPRAPRWFVDVGDDLTHRLKDLSSPVLLLWGDADPLSPVAVGRRLAELLPRAELVVIEGGTHDLIAERAADVIPLIDRHLAS